MVLKGYSPAWPGVWTPKLKRASASVPDERVYVTVVRPPPAGETAQVHCGFGSHPGTEKPAGTTNTILVLWTLGPFSSGTLKISFWSELAGTELLLENTAWAQAAAGTAAMMPPATTAARRAPRRDVRVQVPIGPPGG